MHCGYAYCSSCTDYQALMPRNGPVRGYDLAHVCAFCIDLLNVTALGRSQLRSLPIAKLRWYVDAYNIPVKGAIDKNDIVDLVVATRTRQGCLPVANEAYYRKHAVPKYSSIPGSSSNQPTASRTRNFFTRATSGNPQPSSSSSPNSNIPGSHSRPYSSASSNSRAQAFPRPDLDPRPPETHYRTYTSQSNGPRSRATSGPSSSRPARSTNTQWPRSPPAHSRASSFSRPSNTRPAQPSPPPPPPAPAPAPAPPPLETLLTQSRPSIAGLSVGTLKKILWEARVRIPPGVCEKEDLVERVWAFLEEERRRETETEDDHDSVWEEYYGDDGIGVTTEEEEDAGAAEPTTERNTNDRWNLNDFVTVDDNHLSTPDLGGRLNTRPTSPQPTPDIPTASSMHAKGKARPGKPTEGGLCVVCQDEEANIAIVDCGHLAMCRECSDLVMQSSRECPLCRTRIVTEARLLRIFKT